MTQTTQIGKGWNGTAKIHNPKPFYSKVADTEVLQTKEYQSFKLDIKNRPINEEKVQHFMKQFKQGNFFMKEFPIVVDKDFTVLDGQHRFEASKRMDMIVFFRFSDTLSLDNVVDVQMNAGWTTNDYLHAFIQQGNMNYIVLNRFINRYKISAGIAVMLLTATTHGGLKKSGFYEGTFKVKDETEAHRLAKILFEIGELAFGLHRERKFCAAVIAVMAHQEFEQKRLVEQLEKYGSLIRRQVTTDAYIRNLEEVYNYKLYMKNKVRFI